MYSKLGHEVVRIKAFAIILNKPLFNKYQRRRVEEGRKTREGGGREKKMGRGRINNIFKFLF